MRKKSLTMAAALLVLGLVIGTGCVGSAPVQGAKSPLGANFVAPLTLNTGKVTGNKIGRSTHYIYAFGLLSSGDMGVVAAARNGNITEVVHVEYEYKNVFLFAYQEITTIVYGN